MTVSLNNRGSSQPKPVLKSVQASSSNEWFRPTLIGIVLVLFVGLSLDQVNQGGISCFFSKHYTLQLVGHIRGEDQPCGSFKAGGVSFIQGGQFAVSDTDHNRTLIFDIKGQFLQSLPALSQIESKFAVDPETGLTYTAEWEHYRIVVTGKNGKVQKNIYVRDHPVALALDRKGTLLVGFGNHYFLQAYSLTGQLKGDGQVVNPDPDLTYLDVISLSVADQGYLLAADPYSVWIYKLPE